VDVGSAASCGAVEVDFVTKGRSKPATGFDDVVCVGEVTKCIRGRPAGSKMW
jgi:hypothetical protein